MTTYDNVGKCHISHLLTSFSIYSVIYFTRHLISLRNEKLFPDFLFFTLKCAILVWMWKIIFIYIFHMKSEGADEQEEDDEGDMRYQNTTVE